MSTPEHIQEKLEGRPNTVTQQSLTDLMDNAESEEHVFWGKELVISYRLPNGFTILGRSACVDPANFDLAIGQHFAREDAIKKLWALEGYLLQQRLHESENDCVEHA